MEGDREVVREGEKKQKKSGWFSRDKTAQNTKNVQRPPSSLTLPRHSSSTPASGSDDLPERLATSSHSPNSPEGTVSNDSMASIPIHAGFDFKAIGEMLEKEGKKNKDELSGMQIPTEAPFIPAVRSHTNDTLPPESESTETPRQTSVVSGFSSDTLPVDDSDPDIVSGIESETRADLAQTLTHSLSLASMSDRTASSSSQHESTPIGSLSSNVVPISTSSIRPPPAPTLSFGSSDGSMWTSAQDTIPSQGQSTFRGNVSTSPFAASADLVSSSNGTDSNVPSHPDPFAVPGLSFGSADGAISYGDPWAPPPKDGTTKKASYSTNPWG